MGLSNFITCKLPGGYRDECGALHLEAELIPLGGREEELLAGREKMSGAALVTSVFCNCIRKIGGISPVTEEVARGLLVADRQFLLLGLRRATFGDKVQASVSCPWPDCGSRVDMDFSINDIPVKESANKGPVYTMELSQAAALQDDHGIKRRKIFFRLPNGADQELLSQLVSENEARAFTALLGRCILGIGSPEKPDEKLIHKLSPLARMEIEKEMEAVAPKVELTLGAKCPECGREFSIPFDIQDFFFGELRISRDLLYREVHYLAYHYHWSEREIMEMPKEKRRMYIDILADEIERLNNEV